MGESGTAQIVREVTGMWWPDADSGKLREAASAWKTMATALDEVTAHAGEAARSVIEGNHGKAIDAFRTFWNRYDDGGSKGWLPKTAQACGQLAKALDDFADEVDKAIHKLEEEAAIVGAVLVAGTALAIFTAGISEAAAGAATAGIIAAADALGVAVSETVASIAASTLTGAAFGVVESVAVDLAVAQPVRIAFGDGGFSGAELLTAAELGGVGGAAGGGLGRAARALSQAADGAGTASRTLAGIGKTAAGLDTMPGRMVTGAATGVGQDALFNDGHINPLDVALGAIGGAAARSAKSRSGEDVGAGKRPWPTDPSTGNALTDHDLKFLGLTHEQIEWWRNGEAPLGMTPQTYREWSTSMLDALRADGVPPEAVDVRLLGSAARGFSGPHKQIATEQQITEEFPQDVAHTALERMHGWLGEDPERLKGRPFDSMNKLGLDEPSDYDTNISNDLMVEKARAWWEANGRQGDFLSGDHEYVNKEVARQAFPNLYTWREAWSERLGRDVSVAVFPSRGPKDVSALGHFVHFQDDDWIIHRPEGS